MTPLSLLHRIRWANVARVAAVLGSLALVIAWPRLGPRAPEPPPSAVIEPVPAAPAPVIPEPSVPAADPVAPRGGRSGGQESASAPSRGRRTALRARREAASTSSRPKRRAKSARGGRSGGQESASAPSRTRAAASPPPGTPVSPGARAAAPPSPIAPPAAGPPTATRSPRRQTQQEFGPAPSEFPRRRR